MPPTSEATLLRPNAPAGIGTPAPPPSRIGEQLGSFKLVRELGRGGMGTVYLGEHELIGSHVAVKVLHRHLAEDTHLVQRFLAEARAVNLIAHENIVRIFDMNRAPDGSWFLVMEYLEGKVLSDYATQALSEERTRSILAQLCDALGAAHGRGIVHRDVKPENVMILEQPNGAPKIKLLDFGIARFFGGVHSGMTSVGTVLGTPAFMAPEQWSSGTADHRADIHAVGVMGWLLATGKHPFERFELADLLAASRKVPAEIVASAPPGLRSLLERATAPRAADRFASAAELARALRTASATPDPIQVAPSRTVAVEVTYAGATQTLSCIDPGRGGTFLCTEQTPPPLRAIVKLELKLPGGALACRAEVVRHVARTDAERWKLPAGYAVQFLEGSRAFAQQLVALREGEAPKEVSEDPAVAVRLRDLASHLGSDHYRFLKLPRDASFADVERKLRELGNEVSRLSANPLGVQTRARLTRVCEQLYLAGKILRDPLARAEYDASLRNFRGIARCIAKGLSSSDMARLQARWHADNPRDATRARVHRVSGDFLCRSGQLEDAAAQYEAGLQFDPLDGALQRAYWTTQRQLQTEPRPPRQKAS